MRNFFNIVFKENLWFKIFSVVAISLLVSSFILPPTGAVDPSVLAAVGELFAFASLASVIKAIDKGTTAKVKHNNTELTVGMESEKEDYDKYREEM